MTRRGVSWRYEMGTRLRCQPCSGHWRRTQIVRLYATFSGKLSPVMTNSRKSSARIEPALPSLPSTRAAAPCAGGRTARGWRARRAGADALWRLGAARPLHRFLSHAAVRPHAPGRPRLTLDIYRWQIGNTLSILHRLTGVALALGSDRALLLVGRPWPAATQVLCRGHASCSQVRSGSCCMVGLDLRIPVSPVERRASSVLGCGLSASSARSGMRAAGCGARRDRVDRVRLGA